MSYIARIALGSFVLVHSALAAVGQISACPFTISQPGQYHIVKDLTCPVNGIVVSASNVDLFFDGHTLNGVGAGEFGVLATGSNDSISGGGTVTRFKFDVVIESLSDEAPTNDNRMT